jgi:hypothetical protein
MEWSGIVRTMKTKHIVPTLCVGTGHPRRSAAIH